MGFHEVQFPTGISLGSAGGPGFNVALLEQDSGSLQAVERWDGPRRIYDIAEGAKRLTDLYEIQNFAVARNGPANGFRYKDFLDFASTADGRLSSDGGANGAAVVSFNDQILGTGDGTETEFQLVKTYTSGPTTVVRNITKPVSGTVRVAFDGVEQVSGWSVDTTTGVVLFTPAPTMGVVITAGYEFDVPVRFTQDANSGILAAIRGFDDGDIGSITLIEDLNEVGADEAFYYGGAYESGNITANQFVATGNGRVQRFTPTVSSLKLFLPVADNLPTGGPLFYIENAGSQAISLRNSDDVQVISIPTSTWVTVVLSQASPGGPKTWYAF